VAPLAEGQLVETFLTNQIHFQTLIATKASRVVRATHGRPVVDFGLRRMHGADAGVKAARACAIAGVEATSNVLAGAFYGIPVTGTMAHSYVQAHASEEEAFANFARIYPNTILLVDTYDTLDAVEKIQRLAAELGEAFRIRGIRLDSGDLVALARQARRRLDRAGVSRVEIFASGGPGEDEIAPPLQAPPPIGGVGGGAAMGGARGRAALGSAGQR